MARGSAARGFCTLCNKESGSPDRNGPVPSSPRPKTCFGPGFPGATACPPLARCCSHLEKGANSCRQVQTAAAAANSCRSTFAGCRPGWPQRARSAGRGKERSLGAPGLGRIRGQTWNRCVALKGKRPQVAAPAPSLKGGESSFFAWNGSSAPLLPCRLLELKGTLEVM